MNWEYGNSSCKTELYTGSACTAYLATWQDCIPWTTESDSPVIATLDNQAEAEQLANTMHTSNNRLVLSDDSLTLVDKQSKLQTYALVVTDSMIRCDFLSNSHKMFVISFSTEIERQGCQ